MKEDKQLFTENEVRVEKIITENSTHLKIKDANKIVYKQSD